MTDIVYRASLSGGVSDVPAGWQRALAGDVEPGTEIRRVLIDHDGHSASEIRTAGPRGRDRRDSAGVMLWDTSPVWIRAEEG